MIMRDKTGILVFLAVICVFAQQTTDYLIVEAPIGTKAASNVLWVKWAGVSRSLIAPDSGKIYYDRSPGGGKLANYRYSIETAYTDTSKSKKDSIWNNIYFAPAAGNPIAKRGTAFRAADQKSMGFGVFYCVVALPMAKDTFVSNEFQVIIESPQPVDWIGPTGKISSVTPTFQWNANTGVPYYHIILSDDIIKVDSSSGEVNLQGLSIIWQAITPATQMVYGAPDPSRTITADPPPLSPGQNYTWVVMNNYGNHPAFSSTKIKLPPGEFSITGTSLKKPVCIYPASVTLNSKSDKKVKFKWKNLDGKANTYKLFVYVGSDFEGINAQLVVFQTEVVADGRDGADLIDSVEIDAASVLTSNKYVWRMIAVNNQGAGTVGDTVGFEYKSPIGSMRIYSKEQIVVGSGVKLDTMINPVGLVQLKVEVLDGSLEAPLLFYTDNDGYLDRERPVGTYRVTAIKNEFEEQTRTIVVRDGEKTTTTFFLERPDATVYGKMLDASGKGINLVNVYGISDRGDSISVKADALGNFVLNCYAADWRIGASMTGYQSVLPVKITVASGENRNFGSVTLEKNPYTLSGTVKNSGNAPLLGVRVRLFKDGTCIGEIPSTPENGAFSFTVPAGTYTMLTEKTGFTSYNKPVDVMSSKSINVLLEPGATLVTGYVFGKTRVEGREVIAPITGARVIFVRDSSTDSVVVTSDPTYGDYKASLPGAKRFSMFGSAEGYIAKSNPIVFTTVMKTTQTIHDTLQGLGMIAGTVVMSTGGAAIQNVNVSLVDPVSGKVVTTGKTAQNGSFELRRIYDGSYRFLAGKDGLILDSVAGNDTIVFTGGGADRTSARLYLKPGDKTVRWTAAGGMGVSGSVKLQSPVIKTLSVDDSITKTGPGMYIVAIDAKSDSIVDLAYHRFSVADSEIVHIDTVNMGVVHTAPDTLLPQRGRITLTLKSGSRLDSASIYYKDAVAAAFSVLKDTSKATAYSFSFIPPRDGSVMVYYFTAWKNGDIYGYDRESYSVFIAPDRTMLTRFEIVPSADDTLFFSSEYEASFQVRGYVSSAFVPDTSMDAAGIGWTLTYAQGAAIDQSSGLKTTLVTGSARTTQPVELRVTIDTAKVPLAPGLSNSASIMFNVTGAQLKSIVVHRTDANNPNPITTSPSDQAEFAAIGLDDGGATTDLTPIWSVSPQDGGMIGAGGVFKAKSNFAGIVRIFAAVGSISGEYRMSEQAAPGLNVRFLVVNKSTPDTVGNRIGCSVIFPPHVVGEGDIGLLEISNTVLKNQFKRGFGTVRTVDTLAFDLKQLENVTLDLGSDSIRINLTVPAGMQSQVASRKQHVAVAQWLEDSLRWKPLVNSQVASDGKTVSAGLTHFSTYSLVYEPLDQLSMDIAPNPFSPYIVPNYNPFNPEERVPQHNGTCILVRADIKEARSEVRLRIYNILGDLVWSFLLLNADNSPYYIWWDGRTSDRELQPSGTDHVITIKGTTMCRNGRYFAVVSAKVNGKEQRIMKHIVLMK